MRGAPILPVLMLAASGLQAEEVMAPIHQVGFVVIEDDRSCNGARQRLVRAELKAQFAAREAITEDMCSIQTYRGGQWEEVRIPCTQAASYKVRQAFAPDDTFLLTGKLDICQSLWSSEVWLSGVVLEGRQQNESFGPLALDNFALWEGGSENPGTLQIVQYCARSTVADSSPAFRAAMMFQLNDTGSLDCDVVGCPAVYDVPARPISWDWAQWTATSWCAAAEPGGAP